MNTLGWVVMTTPIGALSLAIVLCLVVGIRGGWQASIRLFLVLGLPIITIIGISFLIAILLPKTTRDMLYVGVVSLILVFTGWRIFRFLLSLRAAGSLVLKDGFSKVQIDVAVGIALFVVWSMITILTLNTIRVESSVLLVWAAYFAIRTTGTLQVRENGILNGITLLRWDRIAAITWADALRHDSLKIVFKSSSKVLKLAVPFEQRSAIDSYLKSRPVQASD